MDPRKSTLPFDVALEVIGYLETGTDTSALRALSTMCYALLEPSQRKLFSEITITITSPTQRRPKPHMLTLYDIFNISPHLSTYIRHLTLSFEVHELDPSGSLYVLKRLTSVESLRINNMIWQDLNPESRPEWCQTIEAIFGQPSLRRLDLEDHGMLPSMVWQLPALTYVDLGKWRIEDTSFIDCPRLTRRLIMSWTQNISRNTLQNFLRVSPNLNQLEVKYMVKHSFGTYPHIVLEGVFSILFTNPPALSTLDTLIFKWNWDFGTYLDPLSTEIANLSACGENVLQQIQFSTHCFGRPTSADILEYFEDFSNSILWAASSHLRLVEVMVHMDDTVGGIYDEDLRIGIHQSFTRLFHGVGVEIIVTLGILSGH